jgi:hypothetical protein
LTRSYESNGPDVKIRGTPSHIAEKYVAMARDALSSGDPVLAENYLQHAEHYNRIIMAHREQQMSHGAEAGQGGHMGRHRHQFDPADDEQPGDDGADEMAAEAPVPRGNEPQPTVPSDDRGADERRPQRRHPRRERMANRDRGGDQEGRDGDSERGGGEQPGGGGQTNGRGGRRQRYAQSDDQPDFLKRPVRRPRAERDADSDASMSAESSDQAAK